MSVLALNIRNFYRNSMNTNISQQTITIYDQHMRNYKELFISNFKCLVFKIL